MTNGLLQAAYIKSKLSKHTGKPDPMLSKLNLLIDQLMREAKNEDNTINNDNRSQSNNKSNDSGNENKEFNSENSEDKVHRSKKNKKSKCNIFSNWAKSRKRDKDESDVIIGRTKKDQFASNNYEDLKKPENSKVLKRDLHEKVGFL